MSQLFHRFYLFVPPIIQNLLLSLYGYLNDFRRYSWPYSRIYKGTLERDCWSSDELIEYQRKRLGIFLKHACKSSFWRARFKDYGVNMDGDPVDEIKKLPILTKEDIRNNHDAIYIRKSHFFVKKVKTSGSTGSSLCFYETKRAESERWAVWWRYRNRFGLSRKDWCGLFGGRTIISAQINKAPYHRYNYASKQVLFSCYHLSINSVESYIETLNNLKLKWLHGYPSFLCELALLARERNLKLSFKPVVVTLGAENVTDNQKLILKNFFQCEVVQHYGLAESVANFSQKPDSDVLFVDEDFSYVEFLESGQSTKIVGTNFTNFSFPLIRYDSGDLATCCDVANYPRGVLSVDGRDEDVVVLPSGRRIGRLDHVFKDIIFVDEAQIYQSEVNKVVVRLKKNKFWTDLSYVKLIRSLRERLGDEIEIEFEFLSKIPRTSSGKVRFVISKLS